MMVITVFIIVSHLLNYGTPFFVAIELICRVTFSVYIQRVLVCRPLDGQVDFLPSKVAPVIKSYIQLIVLFPSGTFYDKGEKIINIILKKSKFCLFSLVMGAKKLTESAINEIINERDENSTPEPFSDSGSEYFCSNQGSTSDESLSIDELDEEIMEDGDGELIDNNETENYEDWNDFDFEVDLFEFIGQEGIKVPLDSSVTAENIFSLFFDYGPQPIYNLET